MKRFIALLITLLFLGCTPIPRIDRSTGTVYRKEHQPPNMLRMNKFHSIYIIHFETLSDNKYSTRWSLRVSEETYNRMKIGIGYTIK